MDYILQLRQYIGHRPILLVGAAVLVLDEQNRLLMMKRSDIVRWGIPGGATEPGEVVEHAARREALEETNLEIGAMSLFGVFSGPEFYFKYPNGDEVYNVTIVYLSRDWHGEVKLNDEHTEWDWFAATEIPEDLSPPIKPVIEQFQISFQNKRMRKPSSMPIKPWKVLETTYFRRWFRIDKCELANGNLLDATVFEFRSWANVLALTKTGEVVLVRQYRHGVCDVLWEFPGGVVEDGEDPAEGAQRELLEETGYAASHLIQVGKVYPNPALQTNALYCYLALDVEKEREQNLDAGEDIEVHLVPLDELLEMAKRGEFPHALMTAVLFQSLIHFNRIH